MGAIWKEASNITKIPVIKINPKKGIMTIFDRKNNPGN